MHPSPIAMIVRFQAKVSLVWALAVAVGAIAVATAHAASVNTCPPGTDNPSYCETSNLPSAGVSFVGGKIIVTRTGMVIDTGMTITCRTPYRRSCGGSAVVTADTGNAARVVTVARGGWHARPGKSVRIKLRIVRKYRKYIRALTKLDVVIKVVGHGRHTAPSKTLTRRATFKIVAG